MGRRGWLGAIPPLFAGIAAAVAMEASAALLLYTADGLLPALTIILTLEIGALGLGVASAPLPASGGMVEQLRRRWMFSLVTFALASALAAGLSFTERMAGTGIGQGAGLAFLGGLPLFSLGTVLGVMSRPDQKGRSRFPHVGTSAVFGAATGFFLAGTLLLPHVAPYTLYLFCLVILSGGALLQGWVLDDEILVEVLERADTPVGEVRVEHRSGPRSVGERVVVLEGGRIRGIEDASGSVGRGWEKAVLDLLSDSSENPGSVLFVGGGSGTLGRALLGRHAGLRLELVERTRELVNLCRSHFTEWDGWDQVALRFEDPLDALSERRGDHAVTIVDCAALPTLGAGLSLRDSDWKAFSRSMSPGGLLVLGGLRKEDSLAVLEAKARRWFPVVGRYEEKAAVETVERGDEGERGGGALFLLTLSSLFALPPSMASYHLCPFPKS